MSNTQSALRALFLSKYESFRRRLRLRLGSEDLADDALHDAWLKLQGLSEMGSIDYPSAYLFRMAVNAAEDQRRGQARLLSVDEVEALYDMADELAGAQAGDVLDPSRIAAGRAEIQELERALDELPPRRRAIVIAARVEELPHRDIALRFGISVRMVEKELRAGLQHCCAKLERNYVQRFGPGAGRTS